MIARSWPHLTPARERFAVAALLAIGAALRLGRYVFFTHAHALGEAYNVAAALADGRGFADAYRAGQGATAHVTPITPVIAGVVYRTFGTGSVASETILGCWSVGLALATYLLLYRAFGRLGVPALVRLGALAFLCMIPAYFWPEAVDFRVWEGGLAACLTALFLDRLLATRMIDVRNTWSLALVAALLSIGVQNGPPIGVQKGPPSSCSMTEMAGTPFALVAAEGGRSPTGGATSAKRSLPWVPGVSFGA